MSTHSLSGHKTRQSRGDTQYLCHLNVCQSDSYSLTIFSGVTREISPKSQFGTLLTCHPPRLLAMTHLPHLPRLSPLIDILQEPPGGCLLLRTELRPWPRGEAGAGHCVAHGCVLTRLRHGHHWSRCDHLSDPSPSSHLSLCSPQWCSVLKRKLDKCCLTFLFLHSSCISFNSTLLVSLAYHHYYAVAILHFIFYDWVSCLRYIFQVCAFKRQSLVSRYSALAHRLAAAILDFCVHSDCTAVYCTLYTLLINTILTAPLHLPPCTQNMPFKSMTFNINMMVEYWSSLSRQRIAQTWRLRMRNRKRESLQRTKRTEDPSIIDLIIYQFVNK